MSDEERCQADEHFPVWLNCTYPDETDISPELIEVRRREYEAELAKLLAIEV